jgi:hypothetical protein
LEESTHSHELSSWLLQPIEGGLLVLEESTHSHELSSWLLQPIERGLALGRINPFPRAELVATTRNRGRVTGLGRIIRFPRAELVATTTINTSSALCSDRHQSAPTWLIFPTFEIPSHFAHLLDYAFEKHHCQKRRNPATQRRFQSEDLHRSRRVAEKLFHR